MASARFPARATRLMPVLILCSCLFLVPAAASAQEPGQGLTALDREYLSILAQLDAMGDAALAPLDFEQLAPRFGNSADEILAAMNERMACVPYHGSMVDPAQAALAGQANPLDRARLLAALLDRLGLQTRIRFLPESEDTAFVNYAASMPEPSLELDERLVAELRGILAGMTPEAVERVAGFLPPATDAHAQAPRVAWVEVLDQEQWTPLLFADTTLAGDVSEAPVLDEQSLSAMTWEVDLYLHATYGAQPVELLSLSRTAAQWRMVPVTLVMLPQGGLETFVPTLLMGDEVVQGNSFSLSRDGQDLDTLTLGLRVRGPGERREYLRPMLMPRTHANDLERAFEIAGLMRLSVVNGPLSDEEMANVEVRNQLLAAQLLLTDGDQSAMPAPVNPFSLSALALVNSSHALAARRLDKMMCFQARPALVMEREFVQTGAGGMTRYAGLDIIDAGHGFYGPAASGQALLTAAVENSLVDAVLEDWLVEEGVTSLSLLRILLDTDSPFTVQRPPEWSRDTVNGAQPVYLTASTAEGLEAGWRLDPGPQLTAILWDGTGGTRRKTARQERLEDICTATRWSAIFIPTSVVPSGVLLSTLIDYFCNLAEAYNEAASVLDSVAGMIESGGETGVDQQAMEDLQRRLENLGNDLRTSLVTNIVSDAVGSHVIGPAVNRFSSGVLRPLGRNLLDRAAPRISDVVGRGAGDAAEHVADKAARQLFNDALSNLVKYFKEQNLNREQRRDYLVHLAN